MCTVYASMGIASVLECACSVHLGTILGGDAASQFTRTPIRNTPVATQCGLGTGRSSFNIDSATMRCDATRREMRLDVVGVGSMRWHVTW